MNEVTNSQWFLEANRELYGGRLVEFKSNSENGKYDYGITFLRWENLDLPPRNLQIRAISCKGISIKHRFGHQSQSVYYDPGLAKDLLFPSGKESLKLIKIKEELILPERINGEQVWRVQIALQLSNEIVIEVNSPESAVFEE